MSPFFRSFAFLVFLGFLFSSALADDPPVPEAPAPVDLSQIKSEIKRARTLQGKEDKELETLLRSLSFSVLNWQGPAKAFGHRREASEALQAAIAESKADGSADRFNDDLDVAEKEIDFLIALPAAGADGDSGALSQSASPSGSAASANTGETVTDAESEILLSVVLIKGDREQGTGFLVKNADGPAVVTALHVLFGNPNIKITTQDGGEIAFAGLKGASDRDVGMISVTDNGYKYLAFSPEVAKEARIGDALMTPGNTKGGAVSPTRGKLLATGNQKIEFNNRLTQESSGAPVYDAKLQKVIGVATEATKVSVGNSVDKNSFASQNSAISGSFRYFGLRLDTVPKWDDYDWNRFQNEGALIAEFHNRTRAIDSYLTKLAKGSGPSDFIDFYKKDESVANAETDFREKLAHNNSPTVRRQAGEQLFVTLSNLADTKVDDLSRGGFSGYGSERVKEELAYRQAIRDSLDKISEYLDHM